MTAISLKGVSFQTQIEMIKQGKLRDSTMVKCPFCNGTGEIRRSTRIPPRVSITKRCVCSRPVFPYREYRDFCVRHGITE